MDCLTFIVEIAKATAWPIAATTIALSFREQIRALIVRMKKGKFGPAEFEFEEAVRELQQTTPVVPDAPQDLKYIEARPRAFILETWLKVDAAARKLGEKHGISTEELPNDVGLLIRKLRLKEVLDWEHEKLYRQLRMLRNSAAHDIDFTPSPESVQSFASLSQSLEQYFLSHAANS